MSYTVFCRHGACSNLPITDIGGPCSSDQDCEGFDYAYYAPVYCGVDNRCGGTSATCSARDDSANGKAYACVTGKSDRPFPVIACLILMRCMLSSLSIEQCLDGRCTTPLPIRQKGETCGPDIGQCAEFRLDCSPGGICGGERARCYRDPDVPADEDKYCVSGECCLTCVMGMSFGLMRNEGLCKLDGLCASTTLSGLQGPCNSTYDCRSDNVQCGSGVCGGGGAACTASNGGTTGFSNDCATCELVPAAPY